MSSPIPAERRAPAPTPVAAGPWTCELRGDEVADIRYDGVRLLRAVRAVVRDEDWNTIPVTVVRRHKEPDGPGAVLDLRFAGPEPDGPVRYDARLSLVVDEHGLRIAFTGTSRSDFRRNRIGLVVLHPLDEAGRPVEHLRPDGSATAAVWPERVSPHQPFREVAGFRWERYGVAAELRFDGDVFETEDQRNWTDASFKTYSTPLRLPFPVDVRAGDVVEQAVRLTARRVSGPSTGHHPAVARPRVDVTDEVVATVPDLSIGAGPGPAPGWAHHGLGFESVLVELAGPVGSWPDRLRSAGTQAEVLGARLDVRVVTGRQDDAVAAVRLLEPGEVARLAVFDPGSHLATPELWDALRQAARERGMRSTLLAGTRGHFAELNRHVEELPHDAGGLTFSITPQMHANEVPHIVESLAGQAAVARDAVRLAAGRPVWIGPVTLRQRFNAVATSGDPVVPAPDPLQGTELNAAWTLGSVAALTRRGVAGLCYYDLSGAGGIGDAGGLFPVGRLLSTLARLSGLPVLGCHLPAGVTGYAVRDRDRVRLFLACLDDEPVECDLRFPGRRVTPLVLQPWAVTEVCLESEPAEHEGERDVDG